MLIRTLLLGSVATATGCAAPIAHVPATPAAPANGGYVWVSGPHWRGSIVDQVTENYTCPGVAGLTATFGFSRPPNDQFWTRRRLLTSLRHSSGRADAATIAEVNEAIMSLESEPEFAPECVASRVQIHLYVRAAGRVASERVIEVRTQR